MKKVFLEISQNLQENTCARASFLIKLQASGGCYRKPLVAASERNNFIQSKAAKIKKVSLAFELTFLLSFWFCTLFKFQFTPRKLGRNNVA